MTWFRVDDSFPSHPKTRSIPRTSRRAVIGTWTTLGAYSARHLTDGLISLDNVLDEGGTRPDALALAKAGLWHPPGVGCAHPTEECPGAPAEGFYQFHDWFEYQPSRAQVLADRAAAAERQRRAREKAKEKREMAGHGVSHGVTDTVTAPVSHGPPVPSRPVPSNPSLVTLVCRRLSGDARQATTTDDDRADLWAMWGDVAGPGVDLEAELRLWLMRNAETDLHDAAGALLGWLRKAAERARGAAQVGCQACAAGWLADDVATGRPVPCPTCRPHLRAVAS